MRLVNALLDFSRIEAGRIQATFEPTDLSAFTTDLASSFRSLVERAGIKLIVDCPQMPEPIYVDRAHWEKIVLNLLSNAFKFTLQGAIAASLSWREDHVELTVRDTGTGIPETEIQRIFERFHRIQGARGRSFEGTGIGLALVQELVQLHGGSVCVSSVEAQGSTFVVSMPVGMAHLPTEQITTGRELAAATSGATPYILEASQWLPSSGEKPGKREIQIEDAAPRLQEAEAAPTGGRLLIADDNADMREYLVRLLTPHWNVEAVEDGEAALASARTRPPELALSDVMMPRLDGFGLLRALRSDARTRTIPIILLSA